MGSHAGTYMDAPEHFIYAGDGVEKIPLDKFMGKAVILDISKKSIAETITNLDPDTYSKIVKVDDIIHTTLHQNK